MSIKLDNQNNRTTSSSLSSSEQQQQRQQQKQTLAPLLEASGIYFFGVISGLLLIQLFLLLSQFLNNASHLRIVTNNLSSGMSVSTTSSRSSSSSSNGGGGGGGSSSSGEMMAFDGMVDIAYQHMLDRLPSSSSPEEQKTFDVTTWTDTTMGGLLDQDRQLLGRIYGQADSVMEYGLGELTYIANYVGVQRYAGIDSDPNWVAMARDKVSDHFRFYLADIGPTKAWGHPAWLDLGKQMLTFQLAPLMLEPRPFDVYMVDARFRFPCVLASFLHASAKGGGSLPHQGPAARLQ
jgi:hypothetical protein